MSQKEAKSTVGDAIWVESCMTREEWKERYKAGYPSSTKPEPPEMFDGPQKWRWGMGKSLTPEEIKLINTRIDNLRKLVRNE